MARSQVLNLADNFKAVITTAAWKTKPSWMLVAGSDRTINPDLERWYATRANSHKVEISGASHSVYVSHPKEVAALIEEAASHGWPTNLGLVFDGSNRELPLLGDLHAAQVLIL